MKRAEKRSLDKDGNDVQPEEKRQRPALASVIVEAVKMDSLQKLCSTLEPLLRRVVGEEVERALAKLAPQQGITRLPGRSSPKRLHAPNSRYLRLQFRSKLALPLFTGSKVEGEGGSAIHVVLQDASTGQVVIDGDEAGAKLEVVVLEGDFSADEEVDWTQEEFEQNIVRERDGKRPLLTGDLSVVLKEGVGTVGELTFTDNSSWIRSRKFRLGIKIGSGQCEGVRIREAKTDAFTVKDHRGELYKKHYPPALHDEVWRLDRIGKDGAFHKRLNQAGIFTVEDFLRLVVMDPQKLRNILGSGMSNKMWEGTVEHAKTCVLNGKLHVYYADDKQNIGVIFNNIFQLMGLIADGQYMSVDLLSESEKIYVDKLVKVAYENWENVVEYDGEALIGIKPYNLRGLNTATEEPGGQNGDARLTKEGGGSRAGGVEPEVSQQQIVSRNFFENPSSCKDQSAASGPLMGGQNQHGQGVMLTVQAQHPLHPTTAPYVELALGRTPAGNFQVPSSGGFDSGAGGWIGGSPGGNNRVGYSEVGGGVNMQGFGEQRPANNLDLFTEDGLLSEEELRAKSMEMLAENEDMALQMQQLLGMLGDMGEGDGGSENPELFLQSGLFNIGEPPFGEARAEPRATAHGRATVGWLKLKAALRWGIFIRKRAAQRRARLEEVEEGAEST